MVKVFFDGKIFVDCMFKQFVEEIFVVYEVMKDELEFQFKVFVLEYFELLKDYVFGFILDFFCSLVVYINVFWLVLICEFDN